MPKEQQLFMRILGLFFIFYGFLILSQPEQYGLSLPMGFAQLVGIVLVIGGIYLALKK
jgi:drug/metabolite transporter (DMT)-like permease